MVVILNGKPDFSNASRPARGIANPVVALQLARNVDEVDDVIGNAPSPDREAMRFKQYLDFGFIALYVGLYAALAVMFGSRLAVTRGDLRRRGRRVRRGGEFRHPAHCECAAARNHTSHGRRDPPRQPRQMDPGVYRHGDFRLAIF